MRRRVFVDTSAYVALAVHNDPHHHDALAILNSLKKQRARLYTTNFVVAETHAFFIRFLGHDAARAYLRSTSKQSVTVVLRAEQNDEERAKSIIFRFTDKDYSMVDAISFAVMESLAISQAFTFDRHFAQYGLQVLSVKHET